MFSCFYPKLSKLSFFKISMTKLKVWCRCSDAGSLSINWVKQIHCQINQMSITLVEWSCSDQILDDFFSSVKSWKAELVVHRHKEDYFCTVMKFTPLFASLINSKITFKAPIYCTMMDKSFFTVKWLVTF